MSVGSRILAVLSLFTSVSTLLCCALPALFVTLGFGATFAGILGAVPQLIWVSEHKGLVFGMGAGLLLVGGILQWRARNAPCPLDPKLAAACMSSRKWSRRLYLGSLALYAVGATFAFVF
ncbi:MAG TPA: hypothetical protein VL588_04475 [Bdellovibrionota bacterium]|nr:hypothetical protein [Bdellovibrionota bacterium]